MRRLVLNAKQFMNASSLICHKNADWRRQFLSDMYCRWFKFGFQAWWNYAISVTKMVNWHDEPCLQCIFWPVCWYCKNCLCCFQKMRWSSFKTFESVISVSKLLIWRWSISQTLSLLRRIWAGIVETNYCASASRPKKASKSVKILVYACFWSTNTSFA